MITVDRDPFLSAEAYQVEARLNKKKGKDVARDDGVPVIITLRHPLAGFTRPVNPTRTWGYRDLTPFFKVANKGQAKKPIIFTALGDIDNRTMRGTSCSASDKQFSSKIKSMCPRSESDHVG